MRELPSSGSIKISSARSPARRCRSRRGRHPWNSCDRYWRSCRCRAPVGELTGLFEIARFSRRPVGTAEREAAWHALNEIRAKLEEEAEVRRAALS